MVEKEAKASIELVFGDEKRMCLLFFYIAAEWLSIQSQSDGISEQSARMVLGFVLHRNNGMKSNRTGFDCLCV